MLCASIDVVPLKYRRSSGLIEHKFYVHQASRRYPDPLIPFCEVRIVEDGASELVKIPIASFEKEFEAISLLARIDGETVRETRYIVVHSAYEALVRSERRVVLHSAIRHSFAHAATSLTRPNVREALTDNFGGLHVNLRSHEHLKIYYRCIVEMLIEIDRTMESTLKSRRSELLFLPLQSASINQAPNDVK